LLRIKEVAIAFIAERMHVTIAALPLDEEIDRGALAITLHLWYDDRRGEEHDDRGAREKRKGGVGIIAAGQVADTDHERDDHQHADHTFETGPVDIGFHIAAGKGIVHI